MKKRAIGFAAALLILAVGIFSALYFMDKTGEQERVSASEKTAVQEKRQDRHGDEKHSPEQAGDAELASAVVSRELSDAVRAVIDDAGDVRRRVKLVNQLPNNLSAADRQALYEYLKSGYNSRETNHLKNDILNTLRNQLTPPPELTQVMLDIFYDEKQSMTMRSYALQHMRPWYWEENMRDPAVKRAFYDGLEQSDNELSGVALLALTYLSEELPDEFDRVFIAEKAALLAGKSEVSELTRVSALDVSSRYGNILSLEIARNILKTEKDNVMLRAAACGAIGRLGNAADIELLDQAQTESSAVRAAARYAKKNINARSGLKVEISSNN